MNLKKAKVLCLRLASSVFLAVIVCVPAFAATITVNTTVDENGTGANCSLREAIEAADTNSAFGGCTAGAVGSDTIQFSALFSSAQTIQVATELAVDTTMTITGPGANLLTIQNIAPAGVNSRPMRVNGSGTVLTMSGVTVTGGNTTVGNGGAGLLVSGSANLTNVNVTGNIADGYGGGVIFETSGTTSSITNCTISNSTSNGSTLGGGGAGIDNSGNLTIVSSTISGNIKTSATGNGGGVYNFSGNLTITNSTVTDNRGDGAGSAGGVFRAGGTVTVRNTIIAANRNNATVPDVGGAFSSSGYNLIGTLGSATGFTGTADQTNVSNANVALSPLGSNGGQTPTHLPSPTSSAVDKGSNFGLTTDQRGATRPFDDPLLTNAPGGNGTDIGAVELTTPVAANVAVSGRVLNESGGVVSRATVLVTDQNGTTRVARTNSFGNFLFADLEVGQIYVFTVTAKGYQFDPLVVTVNENLDGLTLVLRNP